VNLHDGRVKVRAEGHREHLEAYVRDLEKGPPLAHVDRVSVTALPYTGQYREFAIRFSDGR
jgi:acylphosphatase